MAFGAGTELAGGRYRLEHKLGSGGMATVWLGEDLRLARRVAIKVPSEAILADQAFSVRFEREARTAAALSHPHLVSVYDYGYEDERPYLVSEYIDGWSLAELRHRGRPPATAELAAALLEALAHIHAAGIVHRDIKPGNVLVDRGRPDPADRLRDRPIGRRDRADQRGSRRRDAFLPRAGAEARRAGDPGVRPLLARGPALGAVLAGGPGPDREADRRPDRRRAGRPARRRRGGAGDPRATERPRDRGEPGRGRARADGADRKPPAHVQPGAGGRTRRRSHARPRDRPRGARRRGRGDDRARVGGRGRRR